MSPFLIGITLAGVTLSGAALAEFFPTPPKTTQEKPMERLPDGKVNCLIVLPRPMVGKKAKTETAQVMVTNYPDDGDAIILTCETVAETEKSK